MTIRAFRQAENSAKAALLGPHLASMQAPMNHSRPVSRRSWQVVLPFALFVALAAGWTALWFHASSVAQASIAAWREREAQSGRLYTCASENLAGYPFRIEVRCTEAGAQMRSADPPFVVKAKDLLVVAQVYRPNLLIAEVEAPLTFEAPNGGISLIADWTLAQTSVRGLPPTPERISLAVDQFRLDQKSPAGSQTLLTAKHMELHVRLDPDSTSGRPVLDLAARFADAASPAAGSLMPQPIDFEATAVLRGLKDLRLRSLPALLGQLQAAGGRLEIEHARLKRGDMIAVGAGSLGLSPQGRLDGTLRMTVAGFDLNMLKPLFPGVKVSGSLAGMGTNLLGFLGEPAELEGRRAVTMPLRFADGAVSLGPLALGRTAPLY
jgi:hypothetical protein